MFGRFGSCASVLSVWILIGTFFGLIPVAYGHDLPLDRTMNAFIRIEAHQADLVIRIPLDLLHEVSFPLVGDHYDIADSGAATRTALRAINAHLSLWEGNTQLEPLSEKGKLSPLSDRSFESFDAAISGFRAIGFGSCYWVRSRVLRRSFCLSDHVAEFRFLNRKQNRIKLRRLYKIGA